jgi:hypothetical protein
VTIYLDDSLTGEELDEATAERRELAHLASTGKGQ